MFALIVKFLLIVIEVVSSLLLLGAILIQRTRSQGMGMAFGAGMGESLFGGQVGNVLTRATVILGIVFLANTSLLAILYSRTTAEETSVTDTTPAPVALPVPGGAGGPMAVPPVTPPAPPAARGEIPAAAPAADAPSVPAAQPEAATPAAPATPMVDVPAAAPEAAVPAPAPAAQ